ncbi:heme A synthase [Pontibaca methylaminivorans]|uniref:Heme A synthase n=1 Tax=Pontibaca methylaminivorans TaxID=515897 RepID=A0A1R3W883_9RHOB|nr:heme A synthase [Pontibaca methylaminivorans]SIT74205.1 cytochrome c oxidase assembly protein subunit 15 [Pontibaca methylaminivorans]
MSGKRSIFEEVPAEGAQQPATAPGGIDRGRRGARRAIRAWLILLFALVVMMIAVGGLTRLTGSGLSITEWRPVSGALPPLSEADWQAEFEKYQAIDQFSIQNRWMELADFKVIYWWEWSHRQLGRLIGLVWALGFAGFLLARRIPPGWHLRLLIPGLLGAAQGAVGWWMVASGITAGQGAVAVASYRLATHLGLAFAILGVLAWYVFLLGRTERDLMQARRSRDGALFGIATGWLHFAFLQILLGAMVAGIDAGRSFADWPLMGGQIVPPNAWIIEPAWRNLFENAGLVQFIHRIIAYLLLAFGVFAFLRGRRSVHEAVRFAFSLAFAALFLQLVLGILTVVYGVPWQVAILHQLGAIAVFVLILRARFLANYPQVTSLREVRR